MKFKFSFLILIFVLLMIFAVLNGPVALEFSSIFGFTPSALVSTDAISSILNYRWSKVLVAISACGGLALAGLLMQTYFQNPLAGPDVFGLTSGASLGVAISILCQSFLFQFTSLEMSFLTIGVEAVAAFVGSMATFFFITILSQKFRSRTVLLLTGILIASFLSGLISVLVSFSRNDELRDFISWGLGSFEKISFPYVLVLLAAVAIVASLVFFMSNALNLFYLGEKYAETSGLDVKVFKRKIVFYTCFLTALITAVCGPLAFVGIVSSHIAKFFFKTSDHKILIPGTILVGANFGLLVVYFLSLDFALPLPANALMGFIGAPLLFMMLIKKESHLVGQ